MKKLWISLFLLLPVATITDDKYSIVEIDLKQNFVELDATEVLNEPIVQLTKIGGALLAVSRHGVWLSKGEENFSEHAESKLQYHPNIGRINEKHKALISELFGIVK